MKKSILIACSIVIFLILGFIALYLLLFSDKIRLEWQKVFSDMKLDCIEKRETSPDLNDGGYAISLASRIQDVKYDEKNNHIYSDDSIVDIIVFSVNEPNSNPYFNKSVDDICVFVAKHDGEGNAVVLYETKEGVYRKRNVKNYTWNYDF